MARKFKSGEEKALAEEISANIQELMHKKGFRQIDLADRTGIARSTMSDYVNGNTVVPIQAIERIARALGTSKAQLLGSEIHLTEADKLESSLVVELKRELEKANQRIAELEAYIKKGVDLL
ncbi:helix-turn-helix domain-containing protein [Bacillus wiedmannii]|uniref:helix-turn-helix domain-containing protein n=1 Tax=Bacillus wiedmannii TaxID=1890302 RepID=UPI0021CF7FC0|nr:helix-turn-helix transcriptional regulator [Bacillus wiedmannii]MCU5685832.1 helix-turn-helix domain-containing protein [Bacillus wiedmannii]